MDARAQDQLSEVLLGHQGRIYNPRSGKFVLDTHCWGDTGLVYHQLQIVMQVMSFWMAANDLKYR